jgi:hypothetical protein
VQAAQDVMVSAFIDEQGIADRSASSHGKRIVVVAINYTDSERRIGWDLQHAGVVGQVRRYVTSAREGDDLKFYPGDGGGRLTPRSVTTFVIN